MQQSTGRAAALRQRSVWISSFLPGACRVPQQQQRTRPVIKSLEVNKYVDIGCVLRSCRLGSVEEGAKCWQTTCESGSLDTVLGVQVTLPVSVCDGLATVSRPRRLPPPRSLQVTWLGWCRRDCCIFPQQNSVEVSSHSSFVVNYTINGREKK